MQYGTYNAVLVISKSIYVMPAKVAMKSTTKTGLLHLMASQGKAHQHTGLGQKKKWDGKKLRKCTKNEGKVNINLYSRKIGRWECRGQLKFLLPKPLSKPLLCTCVLISIFCTNKNFTTKLQITKRAK